MKTFEERYTAWIDGELDGSALAAFEQELARRAAEGEAAADKAGAIQLRMLLQDHLQAPALTNPDFFNHQLRERIEAENKASARGRETVRHAEPTIFAWGLARLIGLGATCLFAAAALYYGMMPPHNGAASDPAIVSNAPAANRTGNGVQVAEVASPAPAPQAVAPDNQPAAPGPMNLVQRSPTPSPIDLTPDIKTYVPDQPTNPTTITPLHYTRPNVNVLWLNGLEYSPTLPDAASTPADKTVVPAPSAGASP